MTNRTLLPIVFLAGATVTMVFGSALSAQRGSPPVVEPVLAQAARTIGVRQCLSLIGNAAKRATQGASKQDILLDWDHQTPDKGPLFSLTAINVGLQSAAISISAMPGNANSCSLLVERISSTTRPCATLAAQEFAEYQATPLIPNVTVFTRNGSTLESITLIASDGACLVIRRQAVMNAPSRA